MKRAVSGKGRSGTPPLPRQRKALRVVQATLVGVAAVALGLAFSLYEMYRSAGGNSRIGGVMVLCLTALACIAGALRMGIRTVRGPQPPSL